MAQDKILLEGMVFYGYHGVNAAEQELGQRFQVDLEVTLDLSRAGASDRLEETVNYAALLRGVRDIVEGPPRHLLEAVAEEIARWVLAEHPVEEVRVRVKKLSPPTRGGVLAAAGVEILRRRA